MKKKLLFSSLSILAILSSCMLPNKTTVLEPKKEISTEDKLKAEFLQRYKDKKNKSIENVSISINTELQDNNKDTNNVFKVLSDKDNKSTVRNKQFLAGEHPTNESHIKDKDKNIFNPNEPESINSFNPESGDTIISDLGMKISQMNINNKGNLPFEAEKVVLSFSKPEGIELFKSLYNTQVLRQVNNFYEFKLDLSKSPINKVEEILKKSMLLIFKNHLNNKLINDLTKKVA